MSSGRGQGRGGVGRRHFLGVLGLSPAAAAAAGAGTLPQDPPPEKPNDPGPNPPPAQAQAQERWTSIPRTPLGEARLKAARRQFEEIWTYYRQSRTDSFDVYSWSMIVLRSEQDLAQTGDAWGAALEAHLDRMKRLESLVKRVRKLGFGFSIDVGASEYYRLEAEHWLEHARKPEAPRPPDDAKDVPPPEPKAPPPAKIP